jgi:hypothetical protein
LSELEGFKMYSVCYGLSAKPEYDVIFKVWNTSTNIWEEDKKSVEDKERSDLDKFIYCRKMTKTGIIGLFYEENKNAERLYKGFILYIIIFTDIFLVIGIIIGAKIDKTK